jgi:hypothetical protein
MKCLMKKEEAHCSLREWFGLEANFMKELKVRIFH